MDMAGNLPEEMGMNILSRLPIGSLINCKLVSRSWRDLVGRLPLREPLLAVFPLSGYEPKPLPPTPPYQILESDGGGPCRVVLDPPLPHYAPVITSSAKGLILLQNPSSIFMVCNPITREYLRLPPLPLNHAAEEEDEEERRSRGRRRRTIRFGFGVSRMSEQYKVVRIVEDEKEGDYKCHVYTLGTGEWRAIPFPAALRFQWENPECASVGGKLHWLASDGAEVCCFDVETEAFTAFSAANPRRRRYRKLYALEDRLCVAEDSTAWTVIWLMRGAAEWSKQFVIATKYPIRPRIGRQYFPIKVAEDGGGIWLGDGFRSFLFYYSLRTKTIRPSSDFHPSCHFHPYARVFTPSFLSLRSFREEDHVRSF